VLFSPNGGVVGTLSDYSQIDLQTITLIRSKFIEFAKANNLIEDEGVGAGGDINVDSTL
jgi:hypothetical protein